MIVVAAIPPLWRRMMDHRVLAHYGGDVTRANLLPRKREKLLRKFGPGTKLAEEGAAVYARRAEADRIAQEQVAAEEEARRKTFEDAVYQCPVCSYVYRAEAGDPHNGVEPGTPWTAVPNEWNCPECGVGDKVDFVPVDAKAAGSEAVSAD